ncbi:hypothetical protein [Aquipuribacter hungaricus]|uniref:DinB family protein n=1 Tax=Aquipuribacter hungaricus TaxID=545624 RepID=A0ABV7WBA5_9MICO
MTQETRVLLEHGARWVFASALDHPGWARRGKGEDAALQALASYEERYRAVVGDDLCRPGAGAHLQVVESAPGTATTDFGAPDAKGEADLEPLDAAGSARLVTVLTACWDALDAVVARAPAELTRGPRGGGRDRDKVRDHVQEAERSYGRTIGVRVPPRTPWPEQRELLLTGVVAGVGAPPPTTGWPVRYWARRAAWHVLDHAWEIEDRTPSA